MTPQLIDEIHEIEVTLKICTLYKEKPYGLAYIMYTHPKEKDESFEGIGVFNDG